VPNRGPIGFLTNPTNSNAKSDIAAAQAAAHTLDQTLIVAQASTDGDLDAEFARLDEQHLGAVLLAADLFFRGRTDRLAALALQHQLPMLTPWWEGTVAGALASYGASQTDGYRQVGIYVGHILKGEKAADLPVVLPTKFEFALNLKTAKALGLTVPDKLLVAADEVIE
jgi:putative ABC transport system substrate-binding protein